MVASPEEEKAMRVGQSDVGHIVDVAYDDPEPGEEHCVEEKSILCALDDPDDCTHPYATVFGLRDNELRKIDPAQIQHVGPHMNVLLDATIGR